MREIGTQSFKKCESFFTQGLPDEQVYSAESGEKRQDYNPHTILSLPLKDKWKYARKGKVVTERRDHTHSMCRFSMGGLRLLSTLQVQSERLSDESLREL